MYIFLNNTQTMKSYTINIFICQIIFLKKSIQSVKNIINIGNNYKKYTFHYITSIFSFKNIFPNINRVIAKMLDKLKKFENIVINQNNN